MRRVPRRLALALVCVVGGLAACSEDERREASIIEASLPDVTDPELRAETVLLVINACHGDDNRASVTVRDDEVVITVTTDAPAEGDVCADGLTVELPENLAGRPIIDGSTGKTVPLV